MASGLQFIPSAGRWMREPYNQIITYNEGWLGCSDMLNDSSFTRVDTRHKRFRSVPFLEVDSLAAGQTPRGYEVHGGGGGGGWPPCHSARGSLLHCLVEVSRCSSGPPLND